MANFRKISEAMQFAPDKMKKNGLFETERFFCDLYCFEPGQSQAPHTHEGSDKIYYVDRKSTRLNSSHIQKSRMPSSA